MGKACLNDVIVRIITWFLLGGSFVMMEELFRKKVAVTLKRADKEDR